MDKLPQVVLLLESSRGAGRALLRGFANYARHHGPWAFNWEPGGLNEIWPRLSRVDAQGVFLRDGKHVRKVLALGIPTVVVGHRKEDFPGVAHVVTDSEAAGRLAAEHLLGCGFKHFAFCGPNYIRWSAARRESFHKHLKQFGWKVHFFNAPAEGHKTSWKNEHSIMGRWLKSLPKPVGVMACNDDYAHHLVEACKTARLHVPDQVGIIGVDNDELVCELSSPTISSVAINFERAGYESARLLDDWMRRWQNFPAGQNCCVGHSCHSAIVHRHSRGGGRAVVKSTAFHPRPCPRTHERGGCCPGGRPFATGFGKPVPLGTGAFHFKGDSSGSC